MINKIFLKPREGTDAEICLSATRDLVTNAVFAYDSPAIIARMQYDHAAGNVKLTLYTKDDTFNTWGSNRYESGWISFAPSGTLQLAVNDTDVTLSYPGMSPVTRSHGFDFTNWMDGGIAIIEAADISGNTAYAELDNFRVEGPDPTVDTYYANAFENIPDEMMLRALPDNMSAYHYWSSSMFTASYITNDALVIIAEQWQNGMTWLAPYRNYQNGLRMELSGSNVCELAMQVEDISNTNFYMKMCFLPEYIPGKLYQDYSAVFPYLEITIRYTEPGTGKLAFDMYNHTDMSAASWLTYNVTHYFDPGATISYQLSTNRCCAYYGTNLLFNVEHTLDLDACYPDGFYPHIELENRQGTNVTATINAISCEQLNAFCVP